MVNAQVEEIITVLKDVENYTKWFAYTKKAKILNKEQNVQYNYIETAFPWPYENRDMVYEMSIKKIDSVKTKVFLKGIPDYIPKTKGIVRMRKANGYLMLIRSETQTEITYIFHSDPGGDVPSWLANNSITYLPFKTLIGLRKELIK
jgi:hypothetical protein